MPGQALRFSGGWSWFQYNQHMKLVRLSALCTGRLYPQEIFLVLTSVTDWVDPRNTVRPERICQWKFPVTPSRIEPTIFRLLAQCLNKLRHHVLLKQGDITILRILIFTFLGRHGNRRFTYVFSLLLISSYMQFWRISVVPKYFRFATLSKCLFSVSSEITECNWSLPSCGLCITSGIQHPETEGGVKREIWFRDVAGRISTYNVRCSTLPLRECWSANFQTLSRMEGI
jgi:hypothetical protein